jgi:thioesterase domain-containing protein
MTETPQDESSSQSSEPLKIESFLTVLQQKGSRPPLYFAPDLDDLRDTSLYLSKKIDENRPFIETRAVDWKQEDAKGIDIEKIARIISQQIVRSNPEGPYYICGAATGGCVAFAIAGNLVQLGKRVALLALIDSYAPHPHKNEISLSGSLSPLQRLFARLFKIPGAKQKKSNGPKNAAIGSPGAIAVSKYSPSRYPGRITLFCSDEKAENADPLLGWTELADDIMVCEIHSSKGSLLSEKNIDLLANKLRQQIT